MPSTKKKNNSIDSVYLGKGNDAMIKLYTLHDSFNLKFQNYLSISDTNYKKYGVILKAIFFVTSVIDHIKTKNKGEWSKSRETFKLISFSFV